MRVGVIGGGAAGLAAADALRERGYSRVTVLERDDRVGGKCLTIEHDSRRYELGAVAMTPAYRSVAALMAEHGFRAKRHLGGLSLDPHGLRHTYVPPVLRRSWHRFGPQALKLAALLQWHRRIRRPGFAGASPSLDIPFGDWARARGVEIPAALVAYWFTAFGYGYFDRMPALYVLKLASMMGSVSEIENGGYGDLWASVARRLDVRLGAAALRIERRPGGVTVETSAGTFHFDAIILATPLREMLDVLDASPEERDLFSRIRHHDYYVTFARISGIPRDRYMYLPDHLGPPTIGEPMLVYRPFQDRDEVIFYSLGRSADDAVNVEARVRALVARLGGTTSEVLRVDHWRYFPHVLTADLKEGFYARLEALQGTRRTHYTGEILAFPLVEAVTAYSRELVGRFFGPERASELHGAR